MVNKKHIKGIEKTNAEGILDGYLKQSTKIGFTALTTLVIASGVFSTDVASADEVSQDEKVEYISKDKKEEDKSEDKTDEVEDKETDTDETVKEDETESDKEEVEQEDKVDVEEVKEDDNVEQEVEEEPTLEVATELETEDAEASEEEVVEVEDVEEVKEEQVSQEVVEEVDTEEEVEEPVKEEVEPEVEEVGKTEDATETKEEEVVEVEEEVEEAVKGDKPKSVTTTSWFEYEEDEEGNLEQISYEIDYDNETGEEVDVRVVNKTEIKAEPKEDAVKSEVAEKEEVKTHVVSDSGLEEGEKVVTKDYVEARDNHLGEVNKHRDNNGVEDVTLDPVLNRMAEEKAKHMDDNGYFSHDFPDGSKLESQFEHFFDTHLAEDGTRLGENIVRMNAPPERQDDFDYLFNRAFNLFMGSPGHNRNMQLDIYKQMGIGMYINKASNTAHLVQMLSNREMDLTMADIGENEEVIAGEENTTPTPQPEPKPEPTPESTPEPDVEEEEDTPTPTPEPEVEEDGKESEGNTTPEPTPTPDVDEDEENEDGTEVEEDEGNSVEDKEKPEPTPTPDVEEDVENEDETEVEVEDEGNSVEDNKTPSTPTPEESEDKTAPTTEVEVEENEVEENTTPTPTTENEDVKESKEVELNQEPVNEKETELNKVNKGKTDVVVNKVNNESPLLEEGTVHFDYDNNSNVSKVYLSGELYAEVNDNGQLVVVGTGEVLDTKTFEVVDNVDVVSDEVAIPKSEGNKEDSGKGIGVSEVTESEESGVEESEVEESEVRVLPDTGVATAGTGLLASALLGMGAMLGFRRKSNKKGN